jgi:hypothetical protein
MALTVLDYIRFLAPELVSGSGSRERVRCPQWPGDAFAVACSLLQRSGALRSMGTSYLNRSGVELDARAKSIRLQAEDWRRHAARHQDYQVVKDLWKNGITKILRVPVGNIGCFDESSIDGCHGSCEALIELCSLADETFGGHGILDLTERSIGDLNDDQIADLDFKRMVDNLLLNKHNRDRLGATLCYELDPQRVRVLPKAQPPQNGLSTRSLSAYIALCPPVNVPVRWIQNKSTEIDGIASGDKCNLLLIPWPFTVVPSQFHDCNLDSQNRNVGWFGYTPMPDSHEPVKVVKALVEKANDSVGKPDIVVMPETSLTETQHLLVREYLASQRIPLIAGVIKTSSVHDKLGENYAEVSFPEGIEDLESIRQSKHHRWKIDSSQIECYGLANQLGLSRTWWEGISLEDRSINFFVLRDWLCSCVMICEDLARLDPAGQFVRAVAPDLVIALLFDGPQIATRWPAYHATVLADDPGSSVLTLSCLGMTRLSRPINVPEIDKSRNVVGMWRDPRKGSVLIDIPEGKVAAMLTIVRSKSICYTADGRTNSLNDGAPRFAGLNYV